VAILGDLGRVGLLPSPTLVSSRSPRTKNSVSVGPGIRQVTLTSVSLSSLRSAS
jgi:hypothetical protein